MVVVRRTASLRGRELALARRRQGHGVAPLPGASDLIALIAPATPGESAASRLCWVIASRLPPKRKLAAALGSRWLVRCPLGQHWVNTGSTQGCVRDAHTGILGFSILSQRHPPVVLLAPSLFPNSHQIRACE
jgi:hypothetical protein